MGSIFLIHNDGQLVEMAEKQYNSEALLQELLAKYPNLLAGDQINADVPRKWLLVGREMGVPPGKDTADRWSVDHLFLDQDAVPTIVEAKHSSDPRARREVVAQMLDYAANAVVYWPIDKIRTQFRARYDTDEHAEQAIADLLDNPEPPIEEFWQKAKMNLQNGKVRLLFIADKIPPELQRIVEFLNEQMAPAEVLAVEIRQFARESLQTLVPRVIGQTAKAELRKGGATSEGKRWDEPSFLEALKTKRGSAGVEVAKAILQWAKSQKLRIWWGKGREHGSFYPMLDWKGTSHWLFALWTDWDPQIQFGMMKDKPPFNDESKGSELVRRLNDIRGISIPPQQSTKYPHIPFSVLKDETCLKQFLDTFDWVIDEIKKSGQDSRS